MIISNEYVLIDGKKFTENIKFDLSIHDGSWFHDSAKLAIFLPSAIIMLIMSLTGLYLFLKILPSKLRKKRK